MAKSEPIRSDDVYTGRNATHVSYKDNRYVTCWHCGFICHLDRDTRLGGKAGDGVNYDTTFYTTSDSGWGREEYGDEIWGGARELRYEPIVQSGCPMCGCLVYDKQGET